MNVFFWGGGGDRPFERHVPRAAAADVGRPDGRDRVRAQRSARLPRTRRPRLRLRFPRRTHDRCAPSFILLLVPWSMRSLISYRSEAVGLVTGSRRLFYLHVALPSVPSLVIRLMQLDVGPSTHPSLDEGIQSDLLPVDSYISFLLLSIRSLVGTLFQATTHQSSG